MNTAEKILDFLKLPKGWCYLRGIPFKQSTVDLALEVEEYARTMRLDTDAFPGENGEVLIEIYPPEHIPGTTEYLEITIEPTGEIDFAEIVEDEYATIGEVIEMNQVYTILEKYAEGIIDVWEQKAKADLI